MLDCPRRVHSVDRGSALVLAIVVMALLAMLGVALLTMTEDGMKLGRSDARGKQAFYVAEAGLEDARLALFTTNGNNPFDVPLLAASGGTLGNKKIDFDPDALSPSFDSAGHLVGFSAGVGDDVAFLGPAAFGDGTYVAYLSNDAVDGVDSTSDSNGRVLLTSIGVVPGGAMETVQAILETEALWSQPPPAALTLLGPSPGFAPGNSNAKLYSGTDCLGSGTPGFYAPAVGVIGSAAVASVRADMGKPTYEAGGLDPDEAIADLTDPAEPSVIGPLADEWTDCFKLKRMIEKIRSQADVICNNPSCKLPPAAPDRIVFVDGDFVLSDGAGLIVVTGRATMSGNVSWNGPILVVGEGVMHRSGGGGGTMLGSIVVADIAGPDNVYGTDDDCGGKDCAKTPPVGSSCGFQSADFNTSGGGNSTIGYCSTAIESATPLQLYNITDFLQR